MCIYTDSYKQEDASTFAKKQVLTILDSAKMLKKNKKKKKDTKSEKRSKEKNLPDYPVVSSCNKQEAWAPKRNTACE